MTYFLAYTEKPDPPVLRLATTGEQQWLGMPSHCWGDPKPAARCMLCCRAALPEVSSPCPLPRSARTLSAGEDKRVHMWEVGSWKPFAKAQPLQKATCHSIGWAPWGGTGLGAHPSLLRAPGGWVGWRAVDGWVG